MPRLPSVSCGLAFRQAKSAAVPSTHSVALACGCRSAFRSRNWKTSGPAPAAAQWVSASSSRSAACVSSICATAANAAVPSPDTAADRTSGDHALVAADALDKCWAPAFSSSP
ncbi:hypothetical protein [Streptomyces sp. SAI-126]|uniref:hypothetical protein n=1 Tax=Streptomyces sp. SAI-126 TaxID=3377732 RepID=UPI003C7E72B0